MKELSNGFVTNYMEVETMLINNKEFEMLVNGLDFEKNPELEEIVNTVVARYEKSNRMRADWIKAKRAENPEYGHSKEEIEKIRKWKSKGESK